MLIDLHCDSLYRIMNEKLLLDSEKLDVKLMSVPKYGIQCFAVWLPDALTNAQAEENVLSAYKILKRECERLSVNLITSLKNIRRSFNSFGRNALFTIENGKCLNRKIQNVEKFASFGVKMMTLTWNFRNEIGDGCGVEKPMGITDFGKQVISEMEKYGMIVDLSHSSDRLFYDAIETAEKPVAVSHSNSRAVTNNKRNLTDEQFKEIKACGGIVGLNFHNAFLNNQPEKASMTDVLKHTEHFLALGGQDTLAFGSDFDGCVLPEDVSGTNAIAEIYEMFLKHNYKEATVKKIFYENALNFFENFDN